MRRNSAGSGGSIVQGCSQQRTPLEAGALQPRLGLLGAGVVPGRIEVREVRCERLARGDLVADLAQAGRCCRRRRTGPRAGRRASGPRAAGAKSRSWSAIQWKTALEKTASTGSGSSSSVRSATRALSPGLQRLPHLLDHRGRAVDGDHPAPRQALDQQPGDPAAAAAGVEHDLVAGQRQPVEDRPRPLFVRDRDAVVAARVPVAGRRVHQSAVVTGPRSAPPRLLEGVDRRSRSRA